MICDAPEQRARAAKLGLDPPRRQTTSPRRRTEVVDASGSVFGVRENPAQNIGKEASAQPPAPGLLWPLGTGYLECRNHARSTSRPTCRQTLAPEFHWKALAGAAGAAARSGLVPALQRAIGAHEGDVNKIIVDDKGSHRGVFTSLMRLVSF